jgi:hypothetical protein
MVDGHHNEFAGDPTYTALEVFGTTVTSLVRRALKEFDFKVVEEDGSHFRAEMVRSRRA